MDTDKLNNVIGATNTELLKVGSIIGKRDVLDNLCNLYNDAKNDEDFAESVLDYLESEGYNVH